MTFRRAFFGEVKVDFYEEGGVERVNVWFPWASCLVACAVIVAMWFWT